MQITEHDRKILEGAKAKFKEITGKEPANVFIDTDESLQFSSCGFRFENLHSNAVILCDECSKLPCHNRDT